MSSDQRPDSLAAQAASWVPPWEREQRPLDRNYQAAAEDADVSDEPAAPDVDVSDEAEADVSDEAEADVSDEAEPDEDLDRPVEVPLPDDDEDRSAASLSDDDDDFDPSFEGTNPPGYGEVPPELPPIPGESGGAATVDAPTEVSGEAEAEATDLSGDADVPLPASIEDAVAGAEDDELGRAVDAPLPPDGDDAGDVFDAAADDDVSDDAEFDLPVSEDVPDEDDDESVDADESAGFAGEDVGGETDAVPAGFAGDDVGGETDAVPAGFAGEDVGGETDAVPAGFAADDVGGETDAVPAGFAGEDVGVETGAAAAEAAGGGAGGGDGAEAAAFEAGLDDATAAFSSGAAEAQRAKPGLVVPVQGRGPGGPGVAGVGAGDRTAKDLTSGDAEPAADDGLSPIDDTELRAALEAVLLVVDEPVAEMQLAQIMEQPTERVAAMLEDISARYTAAGHGFDLRRAAGGWRLYTRPEYAAYVEKFVLDGQSVRMTQAALETVAVVAYKQPVTRSRISAIRGVNCDGVMRTLVTRGLIEECGTEGETGAYLYRTTPLFLEKLGLNSVDQLPPLAPFLPDDVEEVLDASG